MFLTLYYRRLIWINMDIACVSSKDQNIDRQVVALLEMGIERKIYLLIDNQGKILDRKEYKRLIRKLKSKDELYIKSIDRLGEIMKKLLNNGIF